MSNRLFNVGKVVNTHGIRGEMKILPSTDFPEIRFAKGSKLLLVHPNANERVEASVASSRLHKNVYIVKFQSWDDINEVEKYKGWSLKVEEEQLVELPQDEYYIHQIVSCKVRTEDGIELGEIVEVLSPGANDVWVVKRSSGQLLYLPYIDDVVLDVNVPDKLVTIRVMEGLLE